MISPPEMVFYIYSKLHLKYGPLQDFSRMAMVFNLHHLVQSYWPYHTIDAIHPPTTFSPGLPQPNKSHASLLQGSGSASLMSDTL